MPDDDDQPRRSRGFWSGTLSFGLVSVPVSLFVANRSSRISLRMVDEQGTPLSRVYFCSAEERPLDREDIVRGYEVEKGRFVVVEDEELEAIAPEKSQEINLERFVDLDSIDPVYFERAYYLAPGRGGSRPYRLLAEVMEKSGRAGIATFVMRGKEYLVAIIAERAVLRAETMRFHDELRSPESVGLPALERPDAARVRRMSKALGKLRADELDRNALSDRRSARLADLVRRKLEQGKDVVQGPEDAEPSERESAEVIDLMQVLKQSLSERGTRGRSTPPRRQSSAGRASPRSRSGGNTRTARKPRAAGKRADLGDRSKQELYEQAKRLDIPGRSSMSKEQLIAAIGDVR